MFQKKKKKNRRYQVFSILAKTAKYYKVHGEERREIVHFFDSSFPFCTLLCSINTKYYCLVGFFRSQIYTTVRF